MILFAAARCRTAMREVSTVQEIHSHDRIAGLDQRGVNSTVSRRAGQGLDIDKQFIGTYALVSEQFCAAPPRQCLDQVGEFCPLVITWISVTAIIRQPQVEI